MSHKNEDMCCSIRIIASLVFVMAAIALALHFTGDLMQSGVVGVVALVYAIGFLLGSCAYLHERHVTRQHS